MQFLTGCKIEIIRSSKAQKKDVDQFWQIYESTHHVKRKEFDARLSTFDKLIFFRECLTGKIIGGSAFRIQPYTGDNKKIITCIYIAQSYILPLFRGKQLMTIGYTRIAIECKLKNPLCEIWFWFDALSYKPYMILGKHVYLYYPSPYWPTPEWVRKLIDQIGNQYYSGLYDPHTGVVKKTARRLKSKVGKIEPEDLRNELIQFYNQSNPGHVYGEGLLCVFPGNIKNVIKFLMLMWKKQKQGRRLRK